MKKTIVIKTMSNRHDGSSKTANEEDIIYIPDGPI